MRSKNKLILRFCRIILKAKKVSSKIAGNEKAQERCLKSDTVKK